jgi:hypothetical protein
LPRSCLAVAATHASAVDARGRTHRPCHSGQRRIRCSDTDVSRRGQRHRPPAVLVPPTTKPSTRTVGLPKARARRARAAWRAVPADRGQRPLTTPIRGSRSGASELVFTTNALMHFASRSQYCTGPRRGRIPKGVACTASATLRTHNGASVKTVELADMPHATITYAGEWPERPRRHVRS